ncbi:MAG: FAD-dependent oxidoreductase [Aequorivita sp.]|jgi:glycine/D-amino acid oxidase-like deaminating enzyme|nr:FAD-dependent oxidoreductase [Aequorivita sp.]MBP42195.1 FAD-dependent oxidoreductase [Aequorivita sp.]|tara:strand:- start:6373 stop:7572 length:1200 start_codon:yes stop_codon:yes gene_type:complete
MDVRSNEPFWLIKNSLPQSYPSLKNDISSEVLIIGAGITGALMAYKLINEEKKVVMVDRRDVCNGSTAASTSMLQYEIDVPLHKLIEQVGLTCAVSSYQNCEKAITDLKKIIKEIKADCGFQEKYSVYFASSKNDISFLKDEFEARKNHGFKVKWLTKDEVEKLGLKAYAAIESKSGAVMDVYKLANALLEYCAAKGLEIYDRTEIEKIKSKHEKLIAETKNGFNIEIHDVVHCTGYESTETVGENIVELKSTFALASEAFDKIPKGFIKRIYWNTDAPYLYFRSTDDGRIVMGGGDREFKNAARRDALLPKKEKELVKSFKKCFPNIPFTLDYSWAGTFGETKDSLPYFGKPDPKKNEHYILGFGGNGITFSVMGMDAIVHSINKTPHPYLEYYKFNR